MTFFQSAKAFFTNYANFKGRTSRTTFWWTVLFTFLASTAIGLIFPGTSHDVVLWDGNSIKSYDQSAMENLWDLVTFIPSLAVSVRRLHDRDKSGYNMFFVFLPIIGWIILLMYFLQQGSKEPNKYGEATL